MSKSTIGILVFEGAEELDFVGPYEVFTMVNATLGEGDSPLNEVLLISEDGGDVICNKGMRIGAHYAMAEAPPLDVICVPGGSGSRAMIERKPVVDWLAAIAADCTWVTSVCTGAMLLAAAGLTEGRRITTHWAAVNEFAERGLPGALQQGPRYVRDGNLVTAAGVSAGIDMALWLTGQMHGVERARRTQKAMEYNPAPPYTADV